MYRPTDSILPAATLPGQVGRPVQHGSQAPAGVSPCPRYLVRRGTGQRALALPLPLLHAPAWPPLLPSLLRTQHFGPDEVSVNWFLAGVRGAELQGQALTGGAGECGQALDGAPGLKGKVGAMQLGQSLLDEGHPQLLALSLQGGLEL